MAMAGIERGKGGGHRADGARQSRAARAGLVVAATLLSASTASADVPPPDGLKRVPYQVEVQGLEAHADRVLLVYPWSMSNGRPMAEVGELKPGAPLTFGRRIDGQPRVYAMRRDAYEARKSDAFTLPADGAVDCGLAIEPRHTVPDDAPNAIVATYRVATLSDSACALEPVAVTGDEEAPAPPKPQPSSSAGGSEQAPPPAAPRGGCSSCAVAPPASGERVPTAPLLALAVFAAGLYRRRAAARRTG